MNDERWHRWIAKVQVCLAVGLFFLLYVFSRIHEDPWTWSLDHPFQFGADILVMSVLFLQAGYPIGCAVAHHQQAMHLESRRNAGQR